MSKLTVDYLDENKEYPLVFDINVLAAIQEKFNDMENWGDLLQQGDIPTYIESIRICINEGYYYVGKDKEIDSRRAGVLLSEYGLVTVFTKFNSLAVEFMRSFKDQSKNE